MPQIAKLILAGILIAVAGFCGLGFLATFEPGSSLRLRMVFSAVGLVSFVGAIGLIFNSRSGQPRGFPIEPRRPDADAAKHDPVNHTGR